MELDMVDGNEILYEDLVQTVLRETRAVLLPPEMSLKADGRVMWKKPFLALLEVSGPEDSMEMRNVMNGRLVCTRPDGEEEIGQCQKCTARVLATEPPRIESRDESRRVYAWPCTSYCQSSTHPYTVDDRATDVVLRLYISSDCVVTSEAFRIYTRKRRGADIASSSAKRQRKSPSNDDRSPDSGHGSPAGSPAPEEEASPSLQSTAHLSPDVQETIARLESAVQTLQQQVVTLKEQNKKYFEDKLNSLVGLPVQKRVAVRAYQAPIPSLQSEMYSQVFETQLRNSNIDVEYYSYKRVGDKVITITVCKDEQAAKKSNELALYFLRLFTLENELQIQEAESKILTL